MKKKRTPGLLASAVTLALILSLLFPVSALADDTLPPADEVPTDQALADEVGLEPAAAPDPAEADMTADPIPASGTDPAPLDPEAPSGDDLPPEAALGDGATPEAAAAELLEMTPDGTVLAVVDEQGEILPLASAEAAEILATGDPIWCPASVSAPTPLAGGCTDSFPTFTGLLVHLVANQKTVDGVIWFEDTYDSGVADPGANFIVDGSTNFVTMAAYKLTLRGGWSGVSGDKTIDPTDPSEFNGRLRIVNWANDISLSDLVFTGTPAGGDALQVTTTGDITLTRIDSHGNAGRGAHLQNTTGTGKVKVVDSQFNTNAGADGLYVVSNGSITLTNVIASGNSGGSGATLDNTPSPSKAGVSLTGLNEFNNNYLTGLFITTLGPVTGKDLTANNNGTSGFAGSGMQVFSDLPGAKGGLTLSGTNVFSENDGYGLYVYTLGPVKLSNVIASSNESYSGAYLFNAGATTAQPVTLTGTNLFKDNYSYGLEVSSLGAITISNLTASGNQTGSGAGLSNSAGPGAGVTLTGYNYFIDNAASGLSIVSGGVIKAANLTALGNGSGGSYYGAALMNTGATSAKAVTVSGTNLFSGNRSGGLYIGSAGPIAVSNLTANSTTNGPGANLNNNASASAQKVSLSGKNTFQDNYGTGLQVYSHGPISVSNLTASANGHLSGSGNGVALDNHDAASSQPVKLTGSSLFADNRLYGLFLAARGPVTASNLTAVGNGVTSGSGAYIENTWGDGSAIKLTGKNVFNDNYGGGLEVFSYGPVSLASVTASENHNSNGVSIYNTTPSADIAPSVKLSGSHAFTGNDDYGLTVYSYGLITLSSTNSSGNGYGIGLNNAGGALAKGVTLSGSFTINDNQGHGLDLQTAGPVKVKVKDLTASGNLGYGAYLSGQASTISLSGRNAFVGNQLSGLQITSAGPVTVANLTANANGWGGWGNGASIDNVAAATAQKVSVTGNNTFVGNEYTGLVVSSNGPITVSNITASGTTNGNGASLTNASPTFESPVTITGSAAFDENWYNGLYINSNGTITLKTKTLQAIGNGLWGISPGVDLDNSGAPSPRAVTVKGRILLTGNTYDGMVINSKGAISLSHVTANDNGNGGLYLRNDISGATAGVSLTGTNSLLRNAASGLAIYTYGPIAVGNLTANGNGHGGFGYGALLNNGSAPTPQDAKLSGYGVFHNNRSPGLAIVTRGAISTQNLDASGSVAGEGATLTNDLGPDSKPVTLAGTNVFSDNYYHGLNVISLGAITASNLTASGNGTGGSGYGAYLDSSAAPTPQAVKLTGTNTFNGNQDHGLYVYTVGPISLNNVTAYGNIVGAGAYLRNNLSGSTAGITLTGTNTFVGNGSHGLYMRSAGPVSAARVMSSGNAGRGWYVQSSASITLTCGLFTNNATYGAYLVSSGLIKLIGFFASGNPSGDLYWSGTDLQTVRNCPYW